MKEPHCPTADWELVHGAVHAAKELGQPLHVGPIVSSDVFYNPDGGQYQRWSDRGILAVEMEAAILFTLGALRKVQAGCLLTVSDIVVEGEFKRISDDELRARGRPDDAHRARHRDRRPEALKTVFLVNPAAEQRRRRQALAGARARAAALGLDGRDALLERPGQLIELARAGRRDGAELVVAVGGDGTVNEVVNGLARHGRSSSRSIPRGTGWTSCAPTGSRASSTTRSRSRATARTRHDRPRSACSLPRVGRRRAGALVRERRQRRA